MANSISNSDDVIDSRDVIARIDELESDLESLNEDVESARDSLNELPADAGEDDREDAQRELATAENALADWDDAEELKTLQEFAKEAEGYADDWNHGATLIRDSYFTEYAQQLAEDIGAIGRNLTWPACHIDWEAAADALKVDYTSVDFYGVEYWVR